VVKLKLYSVYRSWRGEFCLHEIEVTEKPKTYIVTEKDGEYTRYYSRLRKENIGHAFEGNYCVGFTPKEAIEGMRKYWTGELDILEQRVDEITENLRNLEALNDD